VGREKNMVLPALLSGSSGSTFSLSTSLSDVVPVITKGFELCTTPPVSYFLVLGIIGAAISIFARAKSAAR